MTQDNQTTKTIFTGQKLLTGMIFSGLIFTAGAYTPAMAKMSLNDQNCNVTLHYDVTVEPKSVKVSEKGLEKYRVEVGQLYVEGKAVALTPAQQKTLTQYSDEVSRQVPEVVELVGEVVTLATQAVTMALTPLLGDAAGSQINKLMNGIEQRVDAMAFQQGDKYFIGSTESSLEQTFNDEFEQEMENIVSNSIGSLMMSMGSQIMSSEGGTFEQKMNAFAAKMDNVGKDIELQMESQSKALEGRADKVCGDFEKLMVLENQLRKDIPQLAPYKLASLEVQSSSK
ncbi:YggN family protein [Shewanella sp. OMA3-2]|uniref:YggN family protein n=1 Tax=Shewanella sp. OMA3-2 TaxID=2908650 RepID=UPI001F40E809|nr:YggN family protein [Shewanella sp. OMA3-2]UJF23114.1 YggN family protein [Shewanella sp. OMA3-2]